MTTLRQLHFYSTPEHECSYISGRMARTLFVDPQAVITTDAYSQLSDLGFRRSGRHIYRPHCEDCQACVSVRIPVEEFSPSKSQRRVLNRNRDLVVERVEPVLTDEHYDLYARYIHSRHSDGDMFPPTVEQFKAFLVDGHDCSFFYEIRDNDRLLSVAVTDELRRGLSAIYTFFDPDQPKRSLGAFSILTQIEQTRLQGLPYLYLGYWVKQCQKMNYKIAYRPLQLLLDGHWVSLR
ncbi:putative arginyl-tRNA--protein transferase [Marinobacterium nitratireducens]|uniref:Aspartate/glutamate leucyltransferase n=1 Tax=Marinobacterium nitratireducens TaxID=518897 RepID=A0A917Z707_9GAMM|nr:arginyltransferase [Marinobacterium nitratireducens]GGO76911.1 putative arginyl-tRNA--protein transferase [Marinobacterium nitratireducens]